MLGFLSRLSAISQNGNGRLTSLFFEIHSHLLKKNPSALQIVTTPNLRNYGIRFTPRSLVIGSFVSTSSNRLPCLSNSKSQNILSNKPLVINLGTPTNKIDMPRGPTSKPVIAPSVTVITNHEHYKEINNSYNVIQEILAPEYTKFKKYAARLIVIRRRKMKKHKLKKLRKKMKFEWAKVRQRREMRKEKAFQASLLEEIRLAEKFNAEEWALDVLKRAKETPIVRKPRKTPEEIMIGKYGRVLKY